MLKLLTAKTAWKSLLCKDNHSKLFVISDNKFLLYITIGCNFWSEMTHLLTNFAFNLAFMANRAKELIPRFQYTYDEHLQNPWLPERL